MEGCGHSEIQNEILQIFGQEIVNLVCAEIKFGNPMMFSVICDGTRDIAGNEQEAICIRYINENFEPNENFVGFYRTTATTGEAISSIIEDVLLRLQLPLSNLRGQCYDGAGNMSGSKKGIQSLIMEKQPLALYVHCGSHLNLIVKESFDHEC